MTKLIYFPTDIKKISKIVNWVFYTFTKINYVKIFTSIFNLKCLLTKIGSINYNEALDTDSTVCFD